MTTDLSDRSDTNAPPLPTAIVPRLGTVLAVVLLALLIPFSVLVVAMRYAANRPIEGADGLIGLTVGLIAFAAFALVSATRRHITVDLIEDRHLGRWRRLRAAFVLFGEAGGYVILALTLARQAAYLGRGGYTYDFAPLPRAWVAWAMTALCLLAVAAVVGRAIALWRNRKTTK